MGLSDARCWQKEEREQVLPEWLFPQWREGDGMPGQNPALESSARSSPQPMSQGGELQELASGQELLAQLPGAAGQEEVACGTGTGQTCWDRDAG